MKKAEILEQEAEVNLETNLENNFKVRVEQINFSIKDAEKSLALLKEEKVDLHKRWDAGERDFLRHNRSRM